VSIPLYIDPLRWFLDFTYTVVQVDLRSFVVGGRSCIWNRTGLIENTWPLLWDKTCWRGKENKTNLIQSLLKHCRSLAALLWV